MLMVLILLIFLAIILLVTVTSIQVDVFYSKMSKRSGGNRLETKFGFSQYRKDFIMNELITIKNVRGYITEDGTAMLNAEDVARGWGFTQFKSGVEYVRWDRVNNYLSEFGFSPLVGKDNFLPENMVYRLGFKASNETAQKFQALLADEVLPSIRKTGSYSVIPKDYPSALRALADQYEKNQKLLAENTVMKPKAEYFDCLVDRNLLTNFRTTAKELHIKQNQFISWLLDNKFVYRDKKGSLQPYSKYTDYFHIKDSKSQTGKWAGTQTLITPKGKEAFRLLLGIN